MEIYVSDTFQSGAVKPRRVIAKRKPLASFFRRSRREDPFERLARRVECANMMRESFSHT